MHAVSWLDRLRIERAVWSLDQQIYDLPRRSRITIRREVRENLLTAARDIGTAAALRNIGSSSRLAQEYLTAEFGDDPRPSWLAAAVFLLTGQLVFTALLGEAVNAFGDGITAADPHATGTFHWRGISYLQDTVTFTMTDGNGSSVGGAWTPLAWVLWLIAAFCVGRLWRLPGVWRRRRQAQPVAA
jgi:hypothetical protein